MTIEFNCPDCRKLLRTSDDKAGASAICPDCKSTVIVPRADLSYPSENENFEYEPADDPPVHYESVTSTITCPFCAEEINSTAVKCRFCGAFVDEENEHRSYGSQPRLIDAGDVISTSWEIFKRQIGQCVLAMLIIMGASLGVVMTGWIGFLVATAIASAIGLGAGIFVGFMVLFVLFFGLIAFSAYLTAGIHIFFVKIARGEEAELSYLFAGSPYILRMLGNMILFNLMVGLGEMFCIVPGILLALMFWPYQFLIVDQNLPGVDSLGQAKEITSGNWGACFILGLAAFGIHLLGSLALGIGIFFTGPFVFLMSAVAYCKMTGQQTARV